MIKKIKTIRLRSSQIAIIFIAACIFFLIGNFNQWHGSRGVIDNDVVSYYAYLPSLFIYHDVTLKFVKDYKGPHRFEFWPLTAPNGGYYHKTTMGLAFCYAPFFFGAHGYAWLSGYDTGGYSPPYHIALLISAMFYGLVGLFFLRKTLQFYFTEEIIALVLMLLTFGTNLFYYISIDGCGSHSFSFGLISAFIYYSLKWHHEKKTRYAMVMGFLLGWIVLIRPTNFLIVLFTIFYDVKSLNELGARIKLVFSHYKQVLIILFFLIIFWIPQMMYWKKVTDHWFFNSYGDEGFFFLRPQIINGLFSFRKGWFIYTPVMIVAMAGLILSFKKFKAMALPVLIFLIINLWVVFSWWCWWYGGGLSQRSLVDTYALMAIPMGVFISWLWQQKYLLKLPLTLVILAMLLLTNIYTIQYLHGGLHYDSMTRAAYIENFGHFEAYGYYPEALDHPDYKLAVKGIYRTAQ